MITTQELHIQLDILLQKVSSNWNKNFLPQEKDFFINREITKFIKQRLNPLSNDKRLSVFDILKRIQDLNSLFRTVPRDIIINPKEAVFELPFDFLHYINSELDVLTVCGNKQVNYENKNIITTTTNPFKSNTTITSGIMTINIGGNITTLFDLGSLPSQYIPQDNIQNYKKLFIYNNALTILIRKNLPKEVEFKYNNETEKLEFRSSTNYTINWTINSITQSVNVSNSVIKVLKNETSLLSNVDIVDEEFNPLIKQSYLSSSKGNNHKALLRQDSIMIQPTASVIAKTAYITYICKPNKVDLLLECNSNLPDEILDEVIANTAETLKAVTSSDTYEKYMRDNMLIE